jgi:F420-non-reducing hydrogenase iron-sulfur subunit
MEITGSENKENKGIKAVSFEPRIIAFVCNWCTYSAADLAGTTRIQYPPNVKLVRLMCSGAIDPIYVLRALVGGFDGVFIGGCHPGDCHYQSGNYRARRRVSVLLNILESVGFNKDRVWLRWISASEGGKFASTISEMVSFLKKEGPNPLNNIWNK